MRSKIVYDIYTIEKWERILKSVAFRLSSLTEMLYQMTALTFTILLRNIEIGEWSYVVVQDDFLLVLIYLVSEFVVCVSLR